MHDYQENFSSQMKITVEDGLIIPITAVLSKSDDQDDDPLLSVPCYTENPDIPIILKLRKSKLARAYSINDFLHPTRVEGLSVVAHGLVTLENSVDKSSIWPLVVSVIDITVNPIPVNIPERLQSLLNIKEGFVLVNCMESIKSAQVEETDISETITCETMRNDSMETSKDYAEPLNLENTHNSSTSLHDSNLEDSVNPRDLTFDSTEKTDTEINKTKDTEGENSDNESSELDNDVVPTQMKKSPNPLTHNNDMIEYSVDEPMDTYGMDGNLTIATMEAENVYMNENLFVQSDQQAITIETNDAPTHFPHSTENTDNNDFYKIVQEKDTHEIAENMSSKMESVIVPAEVDKSLLIDSTDSNVNETEKTDGVMSPPLKLDTQVLSSNNKPDDNADETHDKAFTQEGVDEEMEHELIEVATLVTDIEKSRCSTDGPNPSMQPEQVENESLCKVNGSQLSSLAEPEIDVDSKEVNNHPVGTADAVQQQLKRKRVNKWDINLTELRRSPRLAKKKRVQYFPLTRRINRTKKLLIMLGKIMPLYKDAVIYRFSIKIQLLKIKSIQCYLLKLLTVLSYPDFR
ncbi:uncharacterized protein EV154DRAFT_475657 [Mucor mucedo]|uniref:uncharacterized protein n=1 Tax=Mucor mucedo TaxID=29922 RepID=UPI00221EE69A|nr:uncharacterized protein EV154DRAFT_475657 [Mucor mucedo]KAI7897337.1 hypothetical protein EV154DRAFT_475657 [Mucor mucedo]